MFSFFVQANSTNTSSEKEITTLRGELDTIRPQLDEKPRADEDQVRESAASIRGASIFQMNSGCANKNR